MKLRDANLQVHERKLHMSSFMYFAFILYERITITSSERGFEIVRAKFLSVNISKKSLTCNLPVHLQFI